MTTSRSTLILAQLFISGCMSFLMTLIFSAIPLHFAAGWTSVWMHHWLAAWPVAFVLSLIVGPLCFKASFLVLRSADRLR
ncbi:DUF2798 domain-containing protein [Yangia mangrovi]|uniref:DUF2798 domain-containing protein n=1 Tax=Alloyangia mangrovi TaxID=1779329 RepID=A0A2A3K2D1_9RHOB|nr:DUF2798 domain-containing protein [Alloyangia mangrovi]MCA0943165.1 DUF2798 domain-containing protein [Alloyangia pacifica]MCA0948369.1 DUF2798 domain-containing protein [Alloyangia pacifica]MCT4373162.1 DUF2798 domain-containing protein [Alloyangia mangrovi]